MKNRYRFSLLNTCSGDAANVISVSHLVVGATTTITVTVDNNTAMGPLFYLEDFEPDLNGIREGVLVDSDKVVFTLDYAVDTFDDLLIGTMRTVEWRKCNPKNWHSTKYVWEGNSEDIFKRKRLSGELYFDGGDFTYLRENALDTCCLVLFQVERMCSGAWVQDWLGYITGNMCEWNLSLCYVRVTPEIRDRYGCLDADKAKKVNILARIPRHTISITPQPSVEYFVCCRDNVDISGFADDTPNCPRVGDMLTILSSFEWQNDPDCLPDNGALLQQWTLYKADIAVHTTTPAGGGFVIVNGDACVTYIREVIITLNSGGSPVVPPELGGNPWYQQEAVEINGEPGTKWARTITDCDISYEATWNNDCNQVTVQRTCLYNGLTPIENDAGMYLGDVTEYVVRKTCPDVRGVISDFFEINPAGDTPGYIAGTNYVTGEANKLKNMLIFQKSDVIDPDADQQATIGEVTFEELMTMYRVGFNAFWFIDDAGFLRIEHVSWFSPTPAFNAYDTAFNRKLNEGRDAFKYDRSEVPRQETFAAMEANGFDFIGTPITYGNCSTPGKSNDYNIGRFTTDVNYINAIPADINTDGFVLMAVDQADNSQIDREAGKITGQMLNNAHLSWANLHYNYHRHNRPAGEGLMNGEETTFLTTRRTKRQANIKYYPGCCMDIDPLRQLVTTRIGDGLIDKAEKDNQDEGLKMELLY